MLKIKPFKQSRGYCGPASLKMILSLYGINKSEKTLAKLTKTSRIKGCSEDNLIRVAKSFGFKGYKKQKSSIEELRGLIKKGIPVIVDWFSPEEGAHYSVVVGFDKSNIFLADPHYSKIRKHKISWFEERWFDIFPKPNNLILREIIVISR